MTITSAAQPPAPQGPTTSALASALMGYADTPQGWNVNPVTGLPSQGGDFTGGKHAVNQPLNQAGLLADALGLGASGSGGNYATHVARPTEWVPQSTWWSPSQRQQTYTPDGGFAGATGGETGAAPIVPPGLGKGAVPPVPGGAGGAGPDGTDIAKPLAGGHAPGAAIPGGITSTMTYPAHIVAAAAALGVPANQISPGLAAQLSAGIITKEQAAARDAATAATGAHGQQSGTAGMPGSGVPAPGSTEPAPAVFGPIAPKPGQDTTAVLGFNITPENMPKDMDPAFATNFNFLMNKYGPAYAYDFAMKQTYNQNGDALRTAMTAAGIPPIDVSRVVNQTNQQGKYFDELSFPFQKKGGEYDKNVFTGSYREYDKNTNTYTVGGQALPGSGVSGGQVIQLPVPMANHPYNDQRWV